MKSFIRCFALCLVVAGCAKSGDDAAVQEPVQKQEPKAATVAKTGALGVRLPEVTQVELENGAILLLSPRSDIPMIGFTAILRGGAVTDPAGRAGLSSLVADLLEKGAGERSALEFASTVESVGGELFTFAGREAITIQGSFMSKDGDLMVELLADMLIRPAFEDTEFEKLNARNIQSIKAAKDSDPRSLIGTYAAGFVFKDHPYGTPAGGSESSLSQIQHEDVLTYYGNHIGGDRLILAVVGDFETSVMQSKLEQAFGRWRKAESRLPEVDAMSKLSGSKVLLIDKPGATQTYFWLGNIGVARSFPERAALNLANTIFGGRFTSMLNTELRVKSGLTYGARSRLFQPTKPGSVGIVSYTKTESTVEAIDLALDVLTQFTDNDIPDDVLQSAKNYLAGQFPTNLETSEQLARQFATLEFYDLDKAYVNDYVQNIRAATADEVHAVIKHVYSKPEDLLYVMLGDAEKIRDEVSKYGEIAEMKITDPRFRL